MTLIVEFNKGTTGSGVQGQDGKAKLAYCSILRPLSPYNATNILYYTYTKLHTHECISRNSPKFCNIKIKCTVFGVRQALLFEHISILICITIPVIRNLQSDVALENLPTEFGKICKIL